MQDPIYSKIEGVKRPSLTAASALVLLAVAGLWLSSLAELALGVSGMAALNALYYLPFVGLPILLYARRRPGLGEGMRLNPPPELPLFGVALLALMSTYAASGLSALWSAALDALGLTAPASPPVPANVYWLLWSIVVMAIFPAVFEELLFRGFVLSAWESRGTAFAICVSATLFALLHGNLYGLPAFLLVGAVAGIVTFATDSVYSGILYHTVYNAAVLFFSYMSAGQDAARPPLTFAVLIPFALQTLLILALMGALLAALLRRARAGGVEPIPRIRRPLSDKERLTLWAAVLAMLATILIVQISAGNGGAL